MEQNKPLIVVVGLGAMGKIHAKSLSKVRQVRLGLSSGREDVLIEMASLLCADRIYSSLEATLSDPDVSGIVLATPPPAHPKQIVAAAKAGKHIFSEKPLGYKIEEIQQAQQTITSTGVRFMCGFQRRWDPAYTAAKVRIDSGEFGKAVVYKCTAGDPDYPDKYHRPNAGAEHALFKDLGVHDIDLARWFTGSEVKTVYTYWDAYTYPELKENNDGDNAMGMMHMENGAVVLFHFSRALSYGYNTSAEYVGTNGTLKMGDLHRVDLTELKDQTSGEHIVWDFGERFEKAFEDEIFAFANLVRAPSDEDAAAMVKADKRYSSFEDGFIATKVAEAMVRSSDIKGPVNVVYH